MAPRKNKAVTPTLNMALLASLVSATLANSFVYVSDADAAPLLAHVPVLIIQNPTMKDATGAQATRASDEGVTFYQAAVTQEVTQIAPAPASKPTFNVVMAAPLPEAKRGGGRIGQSIYPFDSMAEPVNGQCAQFFVPATATLENPAKSLASTVSSATRRYATENGTKAVVRVKKDANGNEMKDAAGNPIKETVTIPNLVPTRVFKIYAVADGAPWGFPGVKGAVIARTA